MNTDFLQQPFWGLTVEAYLRFGVILTLAILLRRYVSAFFTKAFYSLFQKFSSGYFAQQFKTLLERPIEGLLVTVLFYVAINQINALLDTLVLLHRTKPLIVEGKKVTTTVVTVMDAIDHIFFLITIYYFILLLSRLLDFVHKVLMHKAQENDDRERQQIFPLLKDVLKVLVWAFGFFTVLGVVFHVNVATLIAGLGVGGIAIAFAAKESLENLLASFMVMIDKPFRIGDWVKVDSVEGIIEKVGIRSSRIRTFDKSIVVLPNRKLIDSSLENFSERGTRRVKFSIGAIYGLSRQTLEEAMNEIKQMINAHPDVSGEPSVYLDGFGDYSVNILVVYFVAISPGLKFEQVKQQVYFGVYEIMYRRANGFAFPTQVEIVGEDLNQVIPPPTNNALE
jgi:MscS family membrane protein